MSGTIRTASGVKREVKVTFPAKVSYRGQRDEPLTRQGEVMITKTEEGLFRFSYVGESFTTSRQVLLEAMEVAAQ